MICATPAIPHTLPHTLAPWNLPTPPVYSRSIPGLYRVPNPGQIPAPKSSELSGHRVCELGPSTAHHDADAHARTHTPARAHTHRPDDFDETNCIDCLAGLAECLEKAQKAIEKKVETLKSQLEQCTKARQGLSTATPLYPPLCVSALSARTRVLVRVCDGGCI